MPRKFWGLCTLLTSIGAIIAWSRGISTLPQGFNFFFFTLGLLLALVASVCVSIVIRNAQRLEIVSKEKEFKWETHFTFVAEFTVSAIFFFSFALSLGICLWYAREGATTNSPMLGPLLLGMLITWGFSKFTGKRLSAKI